MEDADSEFMVQVKTTPGNVHDSTQLLALIEGRDREARRDEAYDRESNRAYLAAMAAA